MLANSGEAIKLPSGGNAAQEGGMILEGLRPTRILGPRTETAEC